ncbi:MAG: autotransporter-associated beta strand repeat-containing protein [Planctomycetia bacterium]
MMLRSVVDAREPGEQPTTRSSARRPADRAGRGLAALLLGALIAAIASPAAAQTTTLSGTTTGNVSISATSGSPLIVGDSVLTGTANFFYGEGSSGAIGTMTSNLSGTGALWFSSPETLVIAGTNTYLGGTSVVNGGLIQVTTGGSISHAASDLRVGVDGGDGRFTLSGGSVGIQSATIGSGYGINSTLTVTSGTWVGSGDLTVAAAGATGVFQLDGGSISALSSTIGTGKSNLGGQPGSNGSAFVTGGTWTTTNGLLLGTASGTGTLTLSGGAVNSGSGVIGVAMDSNGTANVTGGTWINSGDLTVGGTGTGTLSMSGTGTVVVGGTLSRGTNGTITLSSGGTLQIGNGGNSGVLGNDLTTQGTLVFNRTGTSSHTHVIDGSGSVVKQGSGTVILTATNSWSGGTSLNGGALELGSAEALGSSGTISFGGGALRFSADNNADYSSRFNASGGQSFKLDTNGQTVALGSVISGSGSTLEKLGVGTLILAENNIYTGATTVTGGTLQIGAGGNTGAIAGSLVNNAAVVFNRSNDLDLGGAISGSGTLEQAGSGTLTLSGNNNYSGATTLSSGVLSLGSTTALGATSSISFAGGTLQFTAANHADPSALFSTAPGQVYKLDTNGQVVTLTSNLTSTGGSLEKLGGGTLSLTGSNTFAGGTTLTSGTLSLGNAGALGPADPTDPTAGPISFAGGTLQYTVSNTIDYSARFSTDPGQAMSIDTNGQSVTFARDLTSSNATLTKLGSGTLALTGDNDLGGGVSLDGGTLRLGSSGAIGTSGPIDFHGGTLQYTVSNTIDYSACFSGATGQAFSIDTNGQAVTFASALDGAGNTLTKLGSGTLTLSADNGYTGVTTVSAGTLRLGDGNAAGMVAGDILNNAALVFDRSDAPSYGSMISGSGSVSTVGAGTLTLAGANSYTGGTQINAGTLALGSSDAIGTSGTISFGGGVLQYTAANQTDYSGRISRAGGESIRIDTNGELIEFATGLAGAGSTLEKLGSGTLTLSGTSTYSGGTTVSGGTLDVAATGQISHSGAGLVVGTAAGDGTFVVDGGSVSVGNVTLGRDLLSSGTVTINSGTFDASGTLLVGRGDSATGKFTVAGGTVTTGSATIGAGNGVGTATVSGGSWTNSGNLAVGNGTLTISGGTVAVGGTLSELAAGSINLQSNGELRIGTGGAGGALQADLDFAGRLVFNSSGSSTYGGTLAGTGTLTKEGSGTLTLLSAGTYLYSGTTTVSAGGLVVDGALYNSEVFVAKGGSLGGNGTIASAVTVASSGTIAPGLSGTSALLTVGDLDLQSGSEAAFGIGDGPFAGAAGIDYDALRISGTVALATNVTVRLDFATPTPFANGEVFQLFAFDGGSPVGHFSSVVASGIGPYVGVTFRRVDDEWISTYSTSEQFLRFNERMGTLQVVPEPSTWGLLLAGSTAAAVGGLWRRRQKMLGM